MNIFEYIKELMQKEIDKMFEEMPVLMLDMDVYSWKKMLEGDLNADI